MEWFFWHFAQRVCFEPFSRQGVATFMPTDTRTPYNCPPKNLENWCFPAFWHFAQSVIPSPFRRFGYKNSCLPIEHVLPWNFLQENSEIPCFSVILEFCLAVWNVKCRILKKWGFCNLMERFVMIYIMEKFRKINCIYGFINECLIYKTYKNIISNDTFYLHTSKFL